LGGPKPCCAIVEHIPFAIGSEAGNHDANLVRALTLSAGRARGVDGNHDPLKARHGAALQKMIER